MRCPCLEHGDCPIEHLAERVAALEQQRSTWDRIIDVLQQRMEQQRDSRTVPEQAAQPQQPRSCGNCGVPRSECINGGHCDYPDLPRWQPREGGSA